MGWWSMAPTCWGWLNFASTFYSTLQCMCQSSPACQVVIMSNLKHDKLSTLIEKNMQLYTAGWCYMMKKPREYWYGEVGTTTVLLLKYETDQEFVIQRINGDCDRRKISRWVLFLIVCCLQSMVVQHNTMSARLAFAIAFQIKGVCSTQVQRIRQNKKDKIKGLAIW